MLKAYINKTTETQELTESKLKWEEKQNKASAVFSSLFCDSKEIVEVKQIICIIKQHNSSKIQCIILINKKTADSNIYPTDYILKRKLNPYSKQQQTMLLMPKECIC